MLDKRSTITGFAMLQKMGFKPGNGLGKLGEGRTEPIALEVKADRAGLGREAAVKEIMQRKLTMLQKRMAAQSDPGSLCAFRNRKKNEAIQRLTHADLMKSQRMCQVLDEKKDIKNPAESWFWPEIFEEINDDEKQEEAEEKSKDEGNQLEPSEKLELLTSYLRHVHFYCAWCAITFNDREDLSSNCPGPTRDDH